MSRRLFPVDAPPDILVFPWLRNRALVKMLQ
jgi:hypothetical protein